MIYHVYWGTAGNAGLYLDEIYQTLKKKGYEQRVFVNYYYPFDYGEKVFFKRTEMEHCRYKGTTRRILQAIELLFALIKVLLFAKREKPQVVNYSYVSSGNKLILNFLKILKRLSGCTLVITCHDVKPFATSQDAYDRELAIKRIIYSHADYYLIHNENSKQDLVKLFGIDERKVLQHPFPLMDLSKLYNGTEDGRVQYDFLFIGHMRKEKGVDILVEAWHKFHCLYPEASLCIAGNPLFYKDFLLSEMNLLKESNVELLLGFINDNEYLKLIKSARCVVFPYTGGTNSGVISTVVSLGRDVITSDLGMFTSSSFVPNENMFKTGEVQDLVRKLSEYMEGELVSDSKERVANYRESFNKQVSEVYNQVINYNQ